MEYHICETIRELRRTRGISQEVLAAALGVSVQAVSKWETGNSLPDILLFPRIAQFFGVSTDTLFFGTKEEALALPFEDDGRLRVIQFLGKTLVSRELYDKARPIPLCISPNCQTVLQVEIWGSADIEGNVSGYVMAGNGVTCGAVGGYVEAGAGVACGAVSGYVEAGAGVACGAVGGYVETGAGVTCGTVAGEVTCGGDLTCGDIKGDVTNCGGDIKCRTIQGNASCQGDIIYQSN